jgi:hypothetical protein
VTTLPARNAGDVVELVRETVLYSYLPGLFGGPLRWGTAPDSVTTWPTPPTAVVWVAATLGAGLVLGSLWAGRAARASAGRSLGVRHPGAAWVLLASFLGLSIALVARTRLGFVGPIIGRDTRYVTDAALLGPVCLALAWLPLRATASDPGPDPGTDPGPAGGDAPRRRRRLLAAGTAFVLAVTACGAISGERYARQAARNPGAEYLTNLRTDLAAAGGPVPMFDQAVPKTMMMSAFGPGAMLSHVTRPLPERPRFVTWAPAVKVVDDRGHLRDAQVSGVTAPGDPAVCGTTRVVRRLPAAPIAWAWKVQIAYTAGKDTPALVTLDDGRPGARAVPVRLTAGMHKLYVAVLGGGNRFTLSGLAPGVTVCLGQVSVGRIKPAR